jgi:hypothetical protein
MNVQYSCIMYVAVRDFKNTVGQRRSTIVGSPSLELLQAE